MLENGRKKCRPSQPQLTTSTLICPHVFFFFLFFWTWELLWEDSLTSKKVKKGERKKNARQKKKKKNRGQKKRFKKIKEKRKIIKEKTLNTNKDEKKTIDFFYGPSFPYPPKGHPNQKITRFSTQSSPQPFTSVTKMDNKVDNKVDNKDIVTNSLLRNLLQEYFILSPYEVLPISSLLLTPHHLLPAQPTILTIFINLSALWQRKFNFHNKRRLKKEK